MHDDPMTDAYWLRIQDNRVEELEAENARLREALAAIAKLAEEAEAHVDA